VIFSVCDDFNVLPHVTIIDRFVSIVKPKCFYERHAEHHAAKDGIRCYFYKIDLQGRLFLEDTIPKNIAAAIKDNRFLDFFFKRTRHVNEQERLWMSERDIPAADYPFVSPCGKERNFIRPAASPIVFHTLQECEPSPRLLFGGNLIEPFREVDGVAISEKTGRLYHRLTQHALNQDSETSGKAFGLIRSSVAVALSDRIVPVEEEPGKSGGSHACIGLEMNNGGIVPIRLLPDTAEPGLWAMPFDE
jgi:Domain of unknown function (DUF4505)